jgi:hypothetical protein
MKTRKVVPMARKPPRPGALANRIRALVEDGAFSFSSHAFDGQNERDFDLGDALEVLTNGMIEGEIVAGIDAGEWQCKMIGKVEKSSRRLGVVTVVIRDLHVFMTKIAWESAG